MEPARFLHDYIAQQFSHKFANLHDPWPEPDDVALYQNNETGQSLIYEYAEALAARAFLKMCDLPFRLKMEPNAEYMSPTGRIPFLKAGKMVVGDFDQIIDFVGMKGIKLCALLTQEQLSEVQAYIDLIHDVLLKAEMYICWCHEPTCSQLTKPRYSSVYAWPLNYIVTWQRRWEMQKRLSSMNWSQKSLDQVLELVNDCCRSLSHKLADKNYFVFDSQCTELDALVFGHLFTLLTTELPEVDLASIVKRYANLLAFCQRIEKEYFSLDRSELMTK